MSSITPSTSASEQRTKKRRRLWLWFIVGFVVVFVGMALVWPMHFYDGRSVRQASLWQYYLLEIQLELHSSDAIGPTSGNAAAALGVATTHFVISAVAGVVTTGIGWATQKRSPAA
jgi:hypothetical protein